MRTLGLIPARGGSKGVPDKNAKILAGKPLLQWTTEVALACGLFDRIVLSTDSPALARLGADLGVDVPFVRPSALATDQAPMIGVALHALNALALEGYRPDAVCLLQPTSPLRTPTQLVAASNLLQTSGADAVCSVVLVPPELSPHYVMKIDEKGRLEHFLIEGRRYTRRQDVPPAYVRDGSVYLTRAEVLLSEQTFYGAHCAPLVLAADECLTIDTPADWAAAERRLSQWQAPQSP